MRSTAATQAIESPKLREGGKEGSKEGVSAPPQQLPLPTLTCCPFVNLNMTPGSCFLAVKYLLLTSESQVTQ